MKRYLAIMLAILFAIGSGESFAATSKKEPIKQQQQTPKTPKKTQEKAPATEEDEDEDLYGQGEGQEGGEEEDDILEPLNRLLFGINQLLDNLILKPISVVYNAVLPDPAKKSVANFLENLNTPLVTLNFLLQGNLPQAGTTVMRFITNSTVGVLGLFDPAEEMGYSGLHTNFGETFMVWGMGPGPYLVLPIIGPSDVTDAAGRGVTWFTDPLNYWLSKKNDDDYLVWTRTGLTIVSTRAALLEPLDTLEENSLDFYVALRSLYRQQRQAKLAQLKAQIAAETPSVSEPKENTQEIISKVSD